MGPQVWVRAVGCGFLGARLVRVVEEDDVRERRGSREEAWCWFRGSLRLGGVSEGRGEGVIDESFFFPPFLFWGHSLFSDFSFFLLPFGGTGSSGCGAHFSLSIALFGCCAELKK